MLAFSAALSDAGSRNILDERPKLVRAVEMVEPDAEPRLAKFRATYEPFLGGLAEYLVVGLPR
jgi:hypothetical protein